MPDDLEKEVVSWGHLRDSADTQSSSRLVLASAAGCLNKPQELHTRSPEPSTSAAFDHHLTRTRRSFLPPEAAQQSEPGIRRSCVPGM